MDWKRNHWSIECMSSQCNCHITVLYLMFWLYMLTLITNIALMSLVFFCCSQEKGVADKDFVQITYTEAVDLLLGANKNFEYPVTQISKLFFFCYKHFVTYLMLLKSHLLHYFFFNLSISRLYSLCLGSMLCSMFFSTFLCR